MYLAVNAHQAKEIPAAGLLVEGQGYGNRLMREIGFLVSSRHKQRDFLKGKVSQELSLKLSLETAVRENASVATTNRNQKRWEHPGRCQQLSFQVSFKPPWIASELTNPLAYISYSLTFQSKNNLAFKNKSKDYYTLKKGWSCTVTIYNPKKKKYILIVMVKRKTEVKSHSCFALFLRHRGLCTSGFKYIIATSSQRPLISQPQELLNQLKATFLLRAFVSLQPRALWQNWSYLVEGRK